MDRHLLVTIGDDPGVFHGVGFIRGFFALKDRIRITLFHIAPKPPAIWPEEMNYETVSRRDQLMDDIRVKGREALMIARRTFLDSGFTPAKVAEKFIFGAFPRTGDLVIEGESGLYDAVVLGQRGFQGLSDILDRGLGTALFRESVSFPLWVCRLPRFGRKGVLVCVDGSEPSERAVGHVARMLDGETGHPVVLTHVIKPGVSQGDVVGVFERCRGILLDSGLSPDLVRTRSIVADNVAQAVMREAESEGYAVVAAGRTGAGRRGGAFFGSVSATLFHQLSGAVLWVCR